MTAKHKMPGDVHEINLGRETDKSIVPLLIKNVRKNCARKLPFFKCEPMKNGASLVIVGGGPSLADHLDELARLSWKSDNRVICMNDCHNYLIENGIVPWGCVFWEVGSANCAFLDSPRDDVVYLLASHAYRKAYERLKGRNIVIWHAYQNVGEGPILAEYDPGGVSIGGGCSAALRTINMALLMGYHDIHLFGLDSSHEGASHAYYDTTIPEETIEVWCAGKKFRTNWYLARQARDFAEYMEQHGFKFKLTVHGEGLIPFMAGKLGIQVMEKAA